MATAPQIEPGGLKAYFATHRVLETYPTGWHRWWMLLLTVFATIVSFYEFGLSSMLPLWMPALHFSLRQFSWFLTCVVFLSGFSAMAGGPLADRHGRVVVIDVCLLILILLTFANLLMTGFWSFVVVRGSMNLVAGLMWGALGGLTRDMSPRVSRAAAFGLLTVGAVACQWLWNFVPGETLPIFHTWQSQILIMGVVAIALYIPVLLFLKDLSPKLRLMVVDSEATGEAFESGDVAGEAPGTAMEAFKQLLGKWEIWVMVVGVVGFLTVAITIQTFGPTMFEQAFGYDHATADRLTANFWLLNLVMLVPAGIFSDWLGVRKPITIVLTVATLALLIWWTRNFYPPLSPSALGLVTLALGAITAAAFIPWCALYSEYVEDLSAALQATGWSFFQLIYRIWIAFSAPLLTTMTAHIAMSEAAAHHLIRPDARAWSIGWGTWMDVMVAGTTLFIVSLFALRGFWKPATSAQPAAHGAPAHAAGGR
ncbi:MAG TPA: MFS transporter [Candidatus Binataceae bacterium]|nr:MFS transporter [Candidatus Binataceae bacterium]